jgi:hypothetical protein
LDDRERDQAVGKSMARRGFQIVRESPLSEPTAKLWVAIRELKQVYSLPEPEDLLVKRMMRSAVRSSPNLIRPDPEDVEKMLRGGIPEATRAMHDYLPDKTVDEVRAMARDVCREGEPPPASRPKKIDRALLWGVLEEIERIVAPRKFSYRHGANLDPRNPSDSGPADGPMLCVLVETINWVFATFPSSRKHKSVTAEGVLTVWKKERGKRYDITPESST